MQHTIGTIQKPCTKKENPNTDNLGIAIGMILSIIATKGSAENGNRTPYMLFVKRGDLAIRGNELDVPVSNKLLSKESLRKNVLRLLGIAAQEATANGNKLFVCIDGIDHAARAKNQLSFLPSLPTPAEIPDGIRFVVVGQPITLYPDQYPNWMANNQDILYINMPKLRKEDIEQLIFERIPWFATEAKNLAIAIHEKTAGNNLSVAFVVEEIKNTASLDEAYQTLRAPHISDNVNQYYDHIWSHLKEALGQIMDNRVYPESFIACPLLLLNGRVNTRILSQALQLGLSKTDWTLLLKRLRPLVIPTDTPDEYALFHNDFRVYLQSIVYQYTERYEEIAYTLAKYLLENDEGLISYVLGIQLLKHANKTEDIPKYFNTSFVINALAEGVSYTRLDAFAHDAYHAACKKRDFDGYCNVYLAIKTLYQHYSYYEYFGREYLCLDFPEIEQLDINEIRSLPITKDNLDEYEVVLSLCQKLYASKRHDGQARAMNLYNMWFAQYTPLSFLALIRDDLENEEFSLKASNVGILLQHWGQLGATIRTPAKHFETDESFIENYAVTLWGDEYFCRCIEDKQYDLAIHCCEFLKNISHNHPKLFLPILNFLQVCCIDTSCFIRTFGNLVDITAYTTQQRNHFFHFSHIQFQNISIYRHLPEICAHIGRSKLLHFLLDDFLLLLINADFQLNRTCAVFAHRSGSRETDFFGVWAVFVD